MTGNHHALVVDTENTQASGTAEVHAALTTPGRWPGTHRLTVEADKNYDQQRFVEGARAARVTPHVAQDNKGRRSAMDARAT